MSRCPGCSAVNGDGARFCQACGAELSAAATLERRETRRLVTIVFCDLAGSTAMGERLDSESLRQVMARYYEAMRGPLVHHGGTVEKFIGDAVMAVFGVPVQHEDDALRAVRAAFDMRAALEVLNDELEARWGARLQTRTGVNTGEVVAGDPGLGQAFVVGDPVNVAARLEQAAGGGQILLGEETRRLAGDGVSVEELEPLSLKGKSTRMRAFQLLGVVADGPAVSTAAAAAMVGRGAELDALGAAFEHVVAERGCRVVTVLGAAGIGKSRLTDEFLRGVSGRARVLRGRCLPYGEGITYWPVAEVIKQAASITQDDTGEQATAKIAELVPAGADHDAIVGLVAWALGFSEVEADQAETFWAIRRLFEALAEDQPLIVQLEDLHWAEPTFLELVGSVAALSRGRAVLLLCSARPEFADGPSIVADESTALTLTLEPLGVADSRRLIAGLLGDAGSDVVARVEHAAEGNPLFIEELVELMRDQRIETVRDGAAPAVEGASVIAVPLTIEALLGARLDRLDGEQRDIVEHASVVGPEFSREALASLLPAGAVTTLERDLGALVDRRFLRLSTDQDAVDGQRYRFHHVLLRDAAYRRLLKESRADLHERHATWLEQRSALRPVETQELIGYHLERAYRYHEELGPLDQRKRDLAASAAQRLTGAGRRAASRGDAPASANLLGRAAALWPPDDDARLDLLPDLAAALHDTGMLVEAEAILDEVVAVAQRRGDLRLEWRAHLERAVLALATGSESGGWVLRQAQRAVGVFADLHAESEQARAWDVAGRAQLLIGHTALALDAFEHALTHARSSGDRRHEGDALTWLIIAAAAGATPVTAEIDRCREVITSARTDRRATATALVQQARAEARLGHFEAARELAQQGTRMREELGFTVHALGAVSVAAEVEILASNPAGAERLLRSACDGLEAQGERGFRATALAMLGAVLYEQGRYDEAERAAGQSRQLSDEDDIDAQVRWRGVLAKTRARDAAFDEALQLATEAISRIEASDFLDLHAVTLMDLAEILTLQDRHAEAATAVETALALFERKGNVVSAAQAREALAELRR